MEKISETDLIINPDGSVYHLNLLPEDIADTIITVGDQDRVSEVSRYFDTIELKKGKREFITHTGYIGNKRLSVISTGIGTDNIDIVLNELDILANVDFNTRLVNEKIKSLNIIRIGTSGSIQRDIPVGTIMISEFAVGLDALMTYYTREMSEKENHLLKALKLHLKERISIDPYIAAANSFLLENIGRDLPKGVTVTAPGFYAPQGRKIRTANAAKDLINALSSFSSDRYRLTNLEMETAGIYALSNTLGHKALSVNAILASRLNREFSANPAKVVDDGIKLVLERLSVL